MAMLFACIVLTSFVTLPGSDSFEVYLDNELIMQEYIYGQRKNTPVKLDKNSNTKMAVHFNHCGVTGTSRVLSLHDQDNKVLKEWQFADVNPSLKDPMPIAVKDLATVANGGNTILYYKSTELSKPVAIAPIKWIDKSTARN